MATITFDIPDNQMVRVADALGEEWDGNDPSSKLQDELDASPDQTAAGLRAVVADWLGRYTRTQVKNHVYRAEDREAVEDERAGRVEL